MKNVSVILMLFIVGPIWFYLLYSILSAIQVDRLVWFLFWVYVPMRLLVGLIANLLEREK